jgi:hypothetical protein
MGASAATLNSTGTLAQTSTIVVADSAHNFRLSLVLQPDGVTYHWSCSVSVHVQGSQSGALLGTFDLDDPATQATLGSLGVTAQAISSLESTLLALWKQTSVLAGFAVM